MIFNENQGIIISFDGNEGILSQIFVRWKSLSGEFVKGILTAKQQLEVWNTYEHMPRKSTRSLQCSVSGSSETV
jgi:hypothetical protein